MVLYIDIYKLLFMANKVFLVGLGYLGGEVLHTLAHTGITEIIGAARCNDKIGNQITNDALKGAASMGFYPKITFRRVDLNDIKGTSELLNELEPDIIFNTADMHPHWRVHADLPRDIARKLGEGSSVGFCAPLPFRLILPYKLMKAVKRSGIKTHVLITNDPCEVVNPLLGKAGLAPTTGIGDFAHLIEPIKIIVSSKMAVPMRDVKVFLIADFSTGHLLRRRIVPSKSTYFLKVMVDDRDITKKWKPEEILLDATESGTPRAKGQDIDSPIADQHFTASIAVGDMLAILNDTGEIRHCPGPLGLVGGYPVRLSSKGAEVVLPEEISLEEAIKMNEEAQKQEGIEKIRNDGTVVFTDEAVRVMDEIMNWDLKQFNVTECEKVAEELSFAYRELVNRYK